MKTSTFVTSAWIALLAASAGAQQTLGSITGYASFDRLGATAIAIPDQDGDGVPDMAVGAPGSAGQGSVFCLSGRSLGVGVVSVVWIKGPGGAQQGANFGASLVLVGDLTGDSVPDMVVGAPNQVTGVTQTGAIYLINGKTLAIVSMIPGEPNSFTGRALAAVGDQDGDGLPDLIVTASPTNFGNVALKFVSGALLLQGGPIPPAGLVWGASNQGENLASGFDHDHDGLMDVAVGAPSNNLMYIYSADGAWTLLGAYYSGTTTERAATSISAGEDYDGDGWTDFLIGAPDHDVGGGVKNGRVIVVSGASILWPNSPPVVLATLAGPSTNLLGIGARFGTSVLAGPDLTGDGVGEILVGAPDYSTPSFGGLGRGHVSIFSGASLLRIGSLSGAGNDHLGDTLAGGLPDLNGDGFPEFVAAGSNSNNPTALSGVVKFASLYPAGPSSYCTSKPNSLGCTPQVTWTGTASASSSAPFSVGCAGVLNNKSGFLFYSHTPTALPFQGGTLCVKAPSKRTPPQNSGGSATGTDCTGTFSFDFNARIQSGVDASLVPGAEIFSQYWSRDPASPSTTSLSNALRFLINP